MIIIASHEEYKIGQKYERKVWGPNPTEEEGSHRVAFLVVKEATPDEFDQQCKEYNCKNLWEFGVNLYWVAVD